MTLNEFRKHPAYDYYIKTLVDDCLFSDLTNDFHFDYLDFKCVPNLKEKYKDYIIRVFDNIADDVEERIQYYLSLDNYKDVYYVRQGNTFTFYLKIYEQSNRN